MRPGYPRRLMLLCRNIGAVAQESGRRCPESRAATCPRIREFLHNSGTPAQQRIPHNSLRQDGSVTLAFVRHGQTDWNAQGLLQGSSDIPLNETGRVQARDAERMLEAWTWDAVVSSPLARARETARIVADGLGLPLGASYDELVERDYGPLEGTPSLEAIERWPDRRYPGAEPLDEVVDRCLRGLARIDADHPSSNVVVVCHGTIMKYTLIRLTGYPVEVVLNGTVSAIERDGAGWRVLTVNGEAIPE